MVAAGASSLLEEIESAVGASRPREAVDAAVKGFASKAPAIDVIRAAARGAAPRYDGLAPRGLAVLAAAANLIPRIQPRFHPLPTLQGVTFIASERKASAPAKAPLVVSGEITHLGQFFLAVKAWQLARLLGFRDARTILRPAVQYLVRGPRDRTPYESIMTVLGKEWVDLEALAGGGRPLDDAGRTRVAAIASAFDPNACVLATLTTLHDGYAATSIAEGLA